MARTDDQAKHQVIVYYVLCVVRCALCGIVPAAVPGDRG
jgi:hypothetical protein